jgi:ribosome maturation factor RimP
MLPDSQITRIRALAERAAAERAAFVVDVAVRGQAVDVFVDTDAGIGVDELAAISRSLGAALDAEDVLPGRYHLNVSSPGATRPLMLPRQFPRHVGRRMRVQIRAASPEAPPITVEGTLQSVENGTLRLQPEGPEADPIVVPFDDLVEAKVLLPW